MRALTVINLIIIIVTLVFVGVLMREIKEVYNTLNCLWNKIEGWKGPSVWCDTEDVEGIVRSSMTPQEAGVKIKCKCANPVIIVPGGLREMEGRIIEEEGGVWVKIRYLPTEEWRWYYVPRKWPHTPPTPTPPVLR